MPEWLTATLAITGWIGTFGFGGVAVWQFLRDLRQGAKWEERRRGLSAVKAGFVQLRTMLTEAEATGEVVKTDPARQFVRNVGHHAMTIEHQIDSMLASDGKPREPAPEGPPSGERGK
jgi:hypothetical protein